MSFWRRNGVRAFGAGDRRALPSTSVFASLETFVAALREQRNEQLREPPSVPQGRMCQILEMLVDLRIMVSRFGVDGNGRRS
jgi:hypothetical protein